MLVRNYLLIITVSLTSFVYSQGKPNGKGEKKDSNSVNFDAPNMQLDSIITLMNAMNSKVIPYIDTQNGLVNNAHEKAISEYKDTISDLRKDLAASEKELERQKQAKKKSDQDLKKCTDQDLKICKEQNQTNWDNSLKQKNQLEKEIAALAQQSFNIEEAILNSLGERLNITPGVDNAWVSKFNDFKTKRNVLVRANEALSKPYDTKVPQLIIDITTAFASGEQFAELKNSKDELLLLLRDYCKTTKELKSFLERVSKLNEYKVERDKRIQNEIYYYIKYDYFIQIINKNKDDFNHNPVKTVVTNCE